MVQLGYDVRCYKACLLNAILLRTEIQFILMHDLYAALV